MKIARSISAVAAALLITSIVAWPSGQYTLAASDTTFSGQATVVRGQVEGIPVGPLADTGPVSSTGGQLEASLLEYPLAGAPDPTNGALSADVFHAAVHARGNTSHAEATVANFAVVAAGQKIGATFLMSRAEASCNGSTASVSGSSEVADLTLNGQTVTVSGSVNQTVPVPGLGAIVINQQVASASTGQGDITVNALHITLTDPVLGKTTDLVVASAHADIACGASGACANQDFMTGGGWITTSTGAKANFAIAAGTRTGWGHFQYIDHGALLKVKGTGVTMYASTGPTSRHIEGTAEINGSSATYQVDATDNGEPGRSDTFVVTLSNGYKQGGPLGGGNIQLHCR